ncbi:MAG: hypothetical protein JJE22_18665, partial [Bacteroidia bacterium]|nr:hypothetical protein [Bacteroidia bacterium]
KYGYSEEEFLNIITKDLDANNDILANEVTGGLQKPETDEIYKGIFTHKKKSGEIIEVEIFSTPMIVNNQNLSSVIIIDITEKNIYERKISKAIIKTQEDERYEIGGELHDNVCQILAASQMNLHRLKSSLAPSGIGMFDQCSKNISFALQEIRELSHRLAPVFFNDTTLEEAFSMLINSFNLDHKSKILLYVDPEIIKYDISSEIQLNLYRILQEQLRNILKYANADLIEVDVIIYNNRLKMRIADNGVGFKIGNVKGGIGIANMKRRTELFAGYFNIESSPGKGCEVDISLPLIVAQQSSAL